MGYLTVELAYHHPEGAGDFLEVSILYQNKEHFFYIESVQAF